MAESEGGIRPETSLEKPQKKRSTLSPEERVGTKNGEKSPKNKERG